MKSLAYYLQIGAAFSSLLAGFIYIFYNWNKGLFNRLIGFIIITITFGLILSFLDINEYIQLFPHLSNLDFIVLFTVPPLLYFSFFNGLLKKPLKKTDILHFLPVILYIINFTPYFLSSAEEKLILINLGKKEVINRGWLFSAYFTTILNLLQTSFYFILFIFKAKELYDGNTPKLYIEKYLYFSCYMPLQYFPIFMEYLSYNNQHEIGMWLPVFYGLFNMFFFFKIIATPSWLFGIVASYDNSEVNGYSTRSEDVLLKKIEERLQVQVEQLNKLDLDLLEQLNKLCQDNLLFLREDFNQKNLSKLLDTSEYKIRVLLEKAYDLNFVEFNNYLKIRYLLLNYNRKPETWKTMKMNVIAEKLGYKSCNSFYLNFRKIAGITPGDYFQTH